MRFLVKNSRGCGWLAALAVGVLGIVNAHAGGKGDKIQFSEPTTPVVTSNLTANVNPGLERLNPTASGFKQVQEDLFRPLKESLPTMDSLQGDLTPDPEVPPPQPARPLSKHERELIDRERNWAFTDLNQLYPEPSIEDSLGIQQPGDDGKEKNATSVMQKFLDRPAAGKNNKPTFEQTQQTMETTGVFKPDQTAASELKLIVATQVPGDDNGYFGKKLFGDSGNAVDKSDFGGGTSPLEKISPEMLAAQKHRDEFSHLLDPSLPASSKVSSSLIGDQDHTFYTPISALLADDVKAASGQTTQPAKPHHSVLYPIGITDPTADPLHSSVFDDPTAAVLGLPNPILTKPVEQPVTAQSIQKLLDPYSANLPKRGF